MNWERLRQQDRMRRYGTEVANLADHKRLVTKQQVSAVAREHAICAGCKGRILPGERIVLTKRGDAYRHLVEPWQRRKK